MPREVILTMTTVAMDNMIYIMNKNFYINMSWGQSMGYHTFKLLLEEETRDKTIVTRSNTDPIL